MVEGTVRFVPDTGLIAFVTVDIHGFNGQQVTHEVVIDTGFSGALSILPDDVVKLALAPSGSVETTLADGSTKIVATYFASVEWDGVRQLIEVIADDDVPLVGMELLTGYSLSMDVEDGGTVQVTRL